MHLWSEGLLIPTSCRVFKTPVFTALTLFIALSGCNIEEPLSQARVIVAEFDPENGAIPTPSDLLTDDATGRI